MYYDWTDVHALLGGFEEWEAAGYPTEEKETSTGQIPAGDRYSRRSSPGCTGGIRSVTILEVHPEIPVVSREAHEKEKPDGRV
jgi:hypothetical protein